MVALFTLVPATAFAAKTKGGAACFSEELYDELSSYVARKDMKGFQYMLDSGKCLILKEGLDASVIDTTWTGLAKIRVYTKAGSMVLWTAIEFVKM